MLWLWADVLGVWGGDLRLILFLLSNVKGVDLRGAAPRAVKLRLVVKLVMGKWGTLYSQRILPGLWSGMCPLYGVALPSILAVLFVGIAERDLAVFCPDCSLVWGGTREGWV